nr:MAG TPA: hypothetical protein [Caudoviricetes sp.]
MYLCVFQRFLHNIFIFQKNGIILKKTTELHTRLHTEFDV